MAVKVFSNYSRFCISRPCVLAFIIIIFTAFVSVAQTSQPTPPPVIDDEKPISVKTDLVTLTLTVTDLYGRFVSGLSKDAFKVFDNNQEQEITFFSDTDAPISVGIVFDVSGSMSGEKIGKDEPLL